MNRSNSEKVKIPVYMQIALTFLSLIVLVIGASVLVNTFFLDQYYLKQKVNVLKSAYSQINDAIAADDNEELTLEVQRLSDNYNLSVMVLSESMGMVVSSVSDTNMLERQLYRNLFGDKELDGSERLIEETDMYKIQIRSDVMTGDQYIEMWGVMDQGGVFIIRSAMDSIAESAAISNRFLIYIGLIAGVISIIMGFAASKKIARDVARKTEIDEMRKEFISNVSHELKTPIALIQGYAEGLKDCVNDDDESRDFYCDVITDEAAKMNTMVGKLLTLNQLEFGYEDVNASFEEFDVVAMVRGYIQSADILIKQHEATVKFDDSTPVPVWGDEFKAEEVFNNYFSNALNHLSGERIIDIFVKKRDNKVRVSVYNTGENIPEDAIDHIWEKFYKVDKARTREYGGSGVGLSIVKAIQDSVGEKYGVENKPDGVEFYFELDGKH